MAEVMKFDEYKVYNKVQQQINTLCYVKEHGSEAGVKAAGGYRQQGEVLCCYVCT